MNTIEVAKNCLEHNILGVFAGPIHNNYPLKDYIDGYTTRYVGMVSEEDKLEFTKHATLTTYLHKWETVFNQSVIESWAFGTPILANNVGFFKQVLKHGVNGFVYDGKNFKEAFDAASSLKQEDCWKSAREFSVEEMVASFKKAFEEIIEENKI
jgi:glycosyltransferase involved in cell wall biosynthesis